MNKLPRPAGARKEADAFSVLFEALRQFAGGAFVEASGGLTAQDVNEVRQDKIMARPGGRF